MAKKTVTATMSAKKGLPEIRLEDLINNIKQKAYDFYLERSLKGLPGDEVSDWAQAEAFIKKMYKIA